MKPSATLPDPPAARPSLEERVARAQADLKTFTLAASLPGLPAGAASLARSMAHSAEAAIILLRKAMDYRKLQDRWAHAHAEHARYSLLAANRNASEPMRAAARHMVRCALLGMRGLERSMGGPVQPVSAATLHLDDSKRDPEIFERLSQNAGLSPEGRGAARSIAYYVKASIALGEKTLANEQAQPDPETERRVKLYRLFRLPPPTAAGPPT